MKDEGWRKAIFSNIISGYTGMMLTVDGWQWTVNSEQSTRIYYSDANGFDITPNIHLIFFVRCLGGALSLDRKKAQSKALPF